MLSKFDGKCAACGGEIKAGEEIHYSKTAKRGQRAQHIACWQKQQPQQQAPRNDAPQPQAKREGGRVRFSYPSFADMLADVSAPWPETLGNGGDARSVYSRRHQPASGYNSKWFAMPEGMAPIPYVSALAESGWPEGVARLERIRDKLPKLPNPVGVKRRRTSADFGDSLDMPRVWSGDLDRAWQTCRRQSAIAPAPITIACQCGNPANVDSDELFWRAACALVLADELQAAGYTVQIVGYWLADYCLNKGSSTQVDARVTIKAHNAPLDVATVAASLCAPAATRGALYAAISLWAARAGLDMDSGITDGRGYINDEIDAEYGRTIHLAGAGIDNEESASAWLTEALAQFSPDSMPLAA